MANGLIRELRRKRSSYTLFDIHQAEFLMYEKVLAQLHINMHLDQSITSMMITQ